MTSVKAQTVGLRSWPEIHYSGHLTLCGWWSSWPTFGRRAASLFELWPSKTLLWYVREHDICESSNRGIACLARNSLFRAPYAVWFVAIVVNLRSESESVFVPDPQRLCFGMYVAMTSVKAQTVGLRAWPEIHYSGHLTLCGSWPSWLTFGRRAASLFEPGPQRLCFGTYVNMTSVKAQTVGLRSWAENHGSGHLTLCGSWSSWSTFGQRAKAYLCLARKDFVSVCTCT